MDLPFEAQGPSPMPDEHVNFSGGVVVMASVVNVPGAGPKPALVFRFAMPLGGFYPPIALVEDDDQMAKLGALVMQAASAACDGARRAAG